MPAGRSLFIIGQLLGRSASSGGDLGITSGIDTGSMDCTSRTWLTRSRRAVVGASLDVREGGTGLVAHPVTRATG